MNGDNTARDWVVDTGRRETPIQCYRGCGVNGDNTSRDWVVDSGR